MRTEPDIVDAAIKLLPLNNEFQNGGDSFHVLFLIPYSLWRPLKAAWWKGKEVYLIGGDADGNYFLRHSDGSVRYWHHGRQADQVVAPSVRSFLTSLVPPAS